MRRSRIAQQMVVHESPRPYRNFGKLFISITDPFVRRCSAGGIEVDLCFKVCRVSLRAYFLGVIPWFLNDHSICLRYLFIFLAASLLTSLVSDEVNRGTSGALPLPIDPSIEKLSK